MTRPISTSFQAVNYRNVVCRSFGTLDAARAWAKDNAHLHDGLRIERLETSAMTVYTPRVVRSRPDFSISSAARW